MKVYRMLIHEDKLLDISESKTFIVHGGHNYDMMLCLQKEDKPAKDIPQYFCGYCGSYVELSAHLCSCGNLYRQ